MRVVLATRNAHKLREFGRLMEGFEVEGLAEGVILPPEVGETFEENALVKARTAAVATGRMAIADDSGIEAEALGGRPGVRSARYAGEGATDEENLRKLLAEAPAGSALRYVCALALVDVDGSERVFFGCCEGTMAGAPSGEGGFGYDPAFVPDEQPVGRSERVTMAQLSDAEKDAISHRGRAARRLVEWLAGAD